MTKRITSICCLAVCAALLMFLTVSGVQDKKSCTGQEGSQAKSAYAKMVQSKALTKQMAKNQVHAKTKTQQKASSKKMTQSGKGNGGGNGNSSGQGQQGSRSGSRSGAGG